MNPMPDTNTDVNDKCAEQKKDATMQLFIQKFASKVALVLQEVDSSPSRYWAPET